jgi:hypothetical protein
VRKPPTFDRLELQAQLLQCAGTLDGGTRPCDHVSDHVGWSLAPAMGGRRTDVTLFGLCKMHVFHRQGVMAELAERGFGDAHILPWEQLGDLLGWLEDANLIRVA